MNRVIELITMPYMQMSILDRFELAFHIVVIAILCLTVILFFDKLLNR